MATCGEVYGEELLRSNLRDAEKETKLLWEALRAADYYINRLEYAQRRRVVRDMTEAMEGYETARRAVDPFERT